MSGNARKIRKHVEPLPEEAQQVKNKDAKHKEQLERTKPKNG